MVDEPSVFEPLKFYCILFLRFLEEVTTAAPAQQAATNNSTVIILATVVPVVLIVAVVIGILIYCKFRQRPSKTRTLGNCVSYLLLNFRSFYL